MILPSAPQRPDAFAEFLDGVRMKVYIGLCPLLIIILSDQVTTKACLGLIVIHVIRVLHLNQGISYMVPKEYKLIS